jgi:hypothetical protein
MACGQSSGCDGRCRLTGICPDYQRVNVNDLNRYAANASNLVFAQDYANASLARSSNYCARPREMCGKDLGLSLLQTYMLRGDKAWKIEVVPDTPYFWLGAEAETANG